MAKPFPMGTSGKAEGGRHYWALNNNWKYTGEAVVAYGHVSRKTRVEGAGEAPWREKEVSRL